MNLWYPFHSSRKDRNFVRSLGEPHRGSPEYHLERSWVSSVAGRGRDRSPFPGITQTISVWAGWQPIQWKLKCLPCVGRCPPFGIRRWSLLSDIPGSVSVGPGKIFSSPHWNVAGTLGSKGHSCVPKYVAMRRGDFFLYEPVPLPSSKLPCWNSGWQRRQTRSSCRYNRPPRPGICIWNRGDIMAGVMHTKL